MEDKEFDILKEILKGEYTVLCRISGRGVCGLGRMAYTVGLFYGINKIGYTGRYCFHTLSEATKALLEWGGDGDPPGNWIKHKGEIEYSNPNYEKDG